MRTVKLSDKQSVLVEAMLIGAMLGLLTAEYSKEKLRPIFEEHGFIPETVEYNNETKEIRGEDLPTSSCSGEAVKGLAIEALASLLEKAKEAHHQHELDFQLDHPGEELEPWTYWYARFLLDQGDVSFSLVNEEEDDDDEN